MTGTCVLIIILKHTIILNDEDYVLIYIRVIFQTPRRVYKGLATVYGQLHFCLKVEENPGKTSGKQEEGERKNHATQLVVKHIIQFILRLRLRISWIIGILHLFSLSG
jgi:hypothetical protein